MQKKTKRKLNKKRFFGLLLFLAIGAIFITYLLNLKVSNVLITGTSLVSDATIIRKTNLRDYPYYKDYLVRFIDGTEDWLLPEHIRKPYSRKKKQEERFYE